MKIGIFLKTFIFSALLFPISNSFADETKLVKESRFNRCVHLSAVFSWAAMYRDSGISPQEAWKSGIYKDSAWGPITEEERKKIVNQVYFDRYFSTVPAGMMRELIFELCTQPEKNFEPLR